MADRVRIYRNLHKGSLSVKDWDRQSDTYGKVIDRPNTYFLAHPSFIVSQAGRDRVLREKRKNVHAYVQGHPVKGYRKAVLLQRHRFNPKKGKQVFYNPYKNKHFVDSDGNVVTKAEWAYVEATKDNYSIYVGSDKS